jgi:hypothetical protein
VHVIDNSPAGLVLLPGEVIVAVTLEARHQPALAPYNVPVGAARHVAVELGWCTITSGAYRGERAIEVRVDGWRVGELTHLMSRRYAPLVAEIIARGGRPGCVATVSRGAGGLEVNARLPHVTDPPAVVAPEPAAPPQRRRRGLGWIVAGAVAAIGFSAVLVGTGAPARPGPEATATTPTTTAAAKPIPHAKRRQAVSTCDPNYSGCVPVASDVDCAGGGGDGPLFVTGPVRVRGTDVYRLDGDGNGVGCE